MKRNSAMDRIPICCYPLRSHRPRGRTGLSKLRRRETPMGLRNCSGRIIQSKLLCIGFQIRGSVDNGNQFPITWISNAVQRLSFFIEKTRVLVNQTKHGVSSHWRDWPDNRFWFFRRPNPFAMPTLSGIISAG